MFGPTSPLSVSFEFVLFWRDNDATSVELSILFFLYLFKLLKQVHRRYLVALPSRLQNAKLTALKIALLLQKGEDSSFVTLNVLYVCMNTHTYTHTHTHARTYTLAQTHAHCTSCILSHRVFNNLHTTCFKDRKLIIKKWIDCLLRVPFINFR